VLGWRYIPALSKRRFIMQKVTLVSTVVLPRFPGAGESFRLEGFGPTREQVQNLLQRVEVNYCGHPATVEALRSVAPDLPDPVKGFWDGKGIALAARPKGGVRGAAATGDTQVSFEDLEFAVFRIS
jgi:hypothetical protein